VIAGFLLLSLIPVVGGALRVGSIAIGAPIADGQALYTGASVPMLLHVVGATVYCVAGAFQFHQGIRRDHLGVHRILGRVVAVCGAIAALAGIWLAIFAARADGRLLVFPRVAFGCAMAAFIVLGIAAIRGRRVAAHREWMMRGYAVGLAAGTQAVFALGWTIGTGDTARGTANLTLMVSAWVINLAIAELMIRRVRRAARRWDAAPPDTGPGLL
jgi:hypothetical protein